MTHDPNSTPAADPAAAPLSFYDEVGGHDTFVRLVDVFYRGVADDEVLRPMYPEEDLGPAAERLTLFLEQYWGGPTTYSERRGHPRLRMRHAPYHVNPTRAIAGSRTCAPPSTSCSCRRCTRRHCGTI